MNTIRIVVLMSDRGSTMKDIKAREADILCELEHSLLALRPSKNYKYCKRLLIRRAKELQNQLAQLNKMITDKNRRVKV